MKALVCSRMTVERESDLKEIRIDGHIHYHVDRNYGADADGNRGISKTFVTAVTELEAYTEDGDTFKLLSLEVEKASETLTRKFLEQ